ncbi:MAG: ubiquinone/menaquinone biosynthesis methyltransferase [Candidatus Sumerlaeota bacterium]|nr:ubiquinone/menaquinone biosynthesis methyltransferase [Candidatus Sumerlaeota bacterium]
MASSVVHPVHPVHSVHLLYEIPTMNEQAEQIRRMFSAISPRYDLLNHLLSLNVDRRWRRIAVRETAGPSPARVLDVCAGTGDLGFAYLEAMNGLGLVVAADFSGPMLRRGAQKAERRAAQRRIAFVESDGLRLPFPDARFDVAAAAFGLRNLVDWRAGLREMARVVRPGGRVAILDFSLPPNRILRALFLFYFLRFLPFLGYAFTRSRAYEYLPRSVLSWPEPPALAAMMAEAGLRKTRFRRLSFGIACLHVGARE